MVKYATDIEQFTVKDISMHTQIYNTIKQICLTIIDQLTQQLF